MMNVRVFKFGIIGAGRLGKIHTMNLLKIPDVKVKIVADPRLEESKKWASSLGIPRIVSDWHNVIDDPEIDAVVITSPTTFHAEMIMAAADAGKHVFTEKPLSHDLASAKKVLDSLEKTNVKVQVAFNRRFDHNYKKIHDVVISGQIGKLHLIRITVRDPSLPSIEFVKRSGGIFFDFFIHEFDNIRFVTNSEVEEVYAGGNVRWNSEIKNAGDFDTAFAVLKMKCGTLCVIDSSRQAAYGYDQRMEVFGSKGQITSLNDRETSVELKNHETITIDKPLHNFQQRYADSFAAEIQDFVRCLLENKVPLVTPSDGYEAILIAEAATRSAKENRMIKIDELEDISYLLGGQETQ